MIYLIPFDVKGGLCYPPLTMVNKGSIPDSRDYLLRDLPTDLADKLKVAASLHRTTMKGYILEILHKHIEELEKKGMVLKLLKGK
ncbi:MAG TPA: hypothetical protein VF443_03270 [Nitrospira sp.]